jgi:hypothetical protein
MSFQSIAGADVQAMLADDYDFEVDNAFADWGNFNQAMNEYDAARRIQGFIARSARQNRQRHARFWPRLSRRNRRYRESGITRTIRRYL